MKIDVSEVKSFKSCKRAWDLGSRNSMHLRPKITPSAFMLGTVFHESLHKLYVGKPVDEVLEYIRRELTANHSDGIPIVSSMIRGYEREVLPQDLADYEIAQIEWHFEFPATDALTVANLERMVVGYTKEQLMAVYGLTLIGSIDMIVIDKETRQVFGFEHKTCKSYRNATYSLLDEQPRLYFVALQQWVDEFNFKHTDNPVTLGGIFINEVRKLVRAFDYKRTYYTYQQDEVDNFLYSFLEVAVDAKKYHDNPQLPRNPCTDAMRCGMCQYAPVCKKYQYGTVTLDGVLNKFKEFEVREVDHLEEKTEV